MAHAFAELGYGTVVHTRENGFKCGYISAQTPYYARVIGYDSLLVTLTD